MQTPIHAGVHRLLGPINRRVIHAAVDALSALSGPSKHSAEAKSDRKLDKSHQHQHQQKQQQHLTVVTSREPDGGSMPSPSPSPRVVAGAREVGLRCTADRCRAHSLFWLDRIVATLRRFCSPLARSFRACRARRLLRRRSNAVNPLALRRRALRNTLLPLIAMGRMCR